MPDLSVSGTTAGQPVSDAAATAPFAGVGVATTAAAVPYATARAVLSSTANGALSYLGVGTLSADGATYTVSGSPTVVQAALRGLVFTPLAHEVPAGQSVATGFALTVSDAAGAVTDARTSVVATAADTLPTITDTSAMQAPTASAAPADAISSSTRSSFAPFAYTTIRDPDAGASETTSIVLSQNGAATDAVGVLSGAGLTKTGVGSYLLSAASPSAETAALQALRFTPVSPGTAARLAVALTVSDGFGAPVTTTSTIGLSAKIDGDAVVTNSAEYPVTYVDTPVAQTGHGYATTIDAVLNGTLLYERSFDLPYSDPQVQAAVAQAQAAVKAAGATPSGPQQTASNTTLLSTQTTTTETGRSGSTQVGDPLSTFGPNFVGPNADVVLAGGAGSERGFLYVLPGQLDLNINTVTSTTVSRTVTTTSTDLTSQQYVITGTSTALPTTTLVSSSAAGVEGNSTSNASALSERFTANGATTLFTSYSVNFSPVGNNGTYQLYAKTLATGALSLVSATTAGAPANGAAVSSGAVDGDGGLVAFTSPATNLDPRATDGVEHLYLKNMATGALTLLSPADYGLRNVVTGLAEPSTVFSALTMTAISPDGRYVAASATRSGFAAGIVVFDTQAHTAADLTSDIYSTNRGAVFSQNGATLAFYGSDQHGVGDTDATYDVYAYTLATGAFQLVSTSSAGVKGNGGSQNATLSADGTRVAFLSGATNLDPGDTDPTSDVYVKDLTTGRLHLVDVTAAGVKANGPSQYASISPDGVQVVFSSQSTNLVPGLTDATAHIYLKNLVTGALTLLDTTPAGAPGDGPSIAPQFSPDVTKVVYESDADNLVANDVNRVRDVFVTTLAASTTTNTPPAIGTTGPGGGVLATFDAQTSAPFARVTVTDPDAAQSETVTVTYTGANGTFTGAGFTGAAGAYSGTFASAAAAQAALQALVFTPTLNQVAPPQTVTTFFTLSVSDGLATTASSTAFPGVQAQSFNDPPTLGGIAASQPATAGAAGAPFALATVADPDPGQSETVTVRLDAGAGAFAGAGFSGSNGVYTGVFASAAAAQTALRGATFTPTAGATASDVLTVTVADSFNAGANSTASATTTLAVGFTAANTPPIISGAVGGQADAAGVAISPFSQVTVTDNSYGQAAVTVSFAAANGAFSAPGFTFAGGSYTAVFASPAEAQAALRAAVFTPTPGQSGTTTFQLSVSDGELTATDSDASVVATYTPPVVSGGGGGGGTAVVAPSVRYGLLTEFQNLERALATGADALNPATPVYAAFQAEKAVAAQLDSGTMSLAQADAALAHLVDGTTGVAVASYAFFTGYTPTAAGLNYLVHSGADATDLNDAYYAKFSTENRHINFAANLATGAGAGAASFQASYGSLSLADATAKAYLAVFGAAADAAKVSALLNTLVPDGLGGQETRARYFTQYGGDGLDGQGTKAAMVGFLLSNAVHDGSGVYGAATEHYLDAVAHGTAPAAGSELALTYGAAVSLVGVTPVADPTVAG